MIFPGHGIPEMCSPGETAADISWHWWPTKRRVGDPCLCGERIYQGEGVTSTNSDAAQGVAPKNTSQGAGS